MLTWKKIKHHFHEIAKTRVTPHSIALGFAAGTAIGLIPTPGFGVILALLAILIFEKINKISIFIGMAVWNPIVCAPFHVLSYVLGDKILGSIKLTETHATINRLFSFTAKYLLGNIIITITISVATYFIVKYAIILYRKRKEKSAENNRKK
jgi:uncharacterized protein (DUF2062 family)